ncbi:MAG: hypothetical protein N3C62_02325 [Synergistetes bacterium]|nr:hypothetical protein [Synergistota bacterium]MCX8127568.1 hypothetical protein [Synergistota bacterium]MDW8191515.1 hypothetical protein [Synergistota bacterium]
MIETQLTSLLISNYNINGKMGMVKIVGHGILSRFTCELSVNGSLPLREVAEKIGIKEDLLADIVFVRGSFRIGSNDLVYDGDEIHLFVAMCGG